MANVGWPKGKPLGEEHKRKLAEAMRGRKHSEATKRKIKMGMRKHFLEMPADELEDSAA